MSRAVERTTFTGQLMGPPTYGGSHPCHPERPGLVHAVLWDGQRALVVYAKIGPLSVMLSEHVGIGSRISLTGVLVKPGTLFADAIQM